MYRQEIIITLASYGWSDRTKLEAEAAFDAFVGAMRHRQYSAEETAIAWAAFRQGWEAHDRSEE